MDTIRLSEMEIDAIGEILNISLGASATAVSTLLNARVDITTPVVTVRARDEFEFASIEPAVGVEIGYVEGLDGNNIMLLKRRDVKVIVEMLMGMEIPDEEFELDEMNISAVCEVMNQMMGASATALSELLSKTVNISTPVSFEVKSPEMFKDKYFTAENSEMVVIRFNLSIADKMESEFLNLMPISLAKELVNGFFPEGTVESAAPAPAAAPETLAAASAPESSSGGTLSQEEIERMLAGMPTAAPAEASAAASVPAPAAPAPMPVAPAAAASPAPMPATAAPAAAPVQTAPAAAVPAQTVPVQSPGYVASAVDPAFMNSMMQMMDMMRQSLEQQQQQMRELAPRKFKVKSAPAPNLSSNPDEDLAGDNLDLMMDVPMEITVEIGRTRKLVKDILELNKGSLVVLDKLAGEQVDLFVNGQIIARGDVVVVDDNFGIRITEIV